MWHIILYFLTRAHGSCFDCCRPGEVCYTAYTHRPGVCCGSGTCCPTGALCVHCEHGATRCAYPPYTRCQRTQRGQTAGTTVVLFVLATLCGVCACCWLRPHYDHLPSVPVPNTVAAPPPTDGCATGLIGGILLSDVPHGHSPEPEPPSYVEATSEADV